MAASAGRGDGAEVAFVINLIQADLISADETVSRPALETWWGRRPFSGTTSIVDTWVANGWIEELKPVSLCASIPPLYTLRLSVPAVRELLAVQPPRTADNGDSSLASPDDGMSTQSKVYTTDALALFDVTFPSLGASAKKSFLKLHDPSVILYATMGLQLVMHGASTVATFSRDMKAMGVDAQTRTMVTNYLAKSPILPSSSSAKLQPAPHPRS
ncbi:hypothetical protein DYB30_003010 [Aphanomyces astaci]|uniref:Uncharacterized protein n=1 Tax=Aphanomyces astaci TaxID=112090 RepID=A0A397C2Y4_APHAT|nr:hypothetical protein DYB30_003010 [Aphanomyces astaci]RHY93227.1 hypothetical protein DYB31_014501 [Aphanomyces astaci]RHZ39050.1 hypothetical protein DYB26_002022 [Aphanomyces astaci]